MALVDTDQKILREIVDQGGRRFSGGTSGNVTRIVFDTVAIAEFLDHLHVEKGAFLDALGFDEKVASNMKKRTLVYDEMFRMADESAAEGEGIILDATFVTQTLRRRAAEVAAKYGMRLVIQQTQCPKEISLRRISERTKENYESNALTEQAYTNNVKKFEPVDLEDLKSLYPDLNIIHLLVDTTSNLTEEWFVIGKVTR